MWASITYDINEGIYPYNNLRDCVYLLKIFLCNIRQQQLPIRLEQRVKKIYIPVILLQERNSFIFREVLVEKNEGYVVLLYIIHVTCKKMVYYNFFFYKSKQVNIFEKRYEQRDNHKFPPIYNKTLRVRMKNFFISYPLHNHTINLLFNQL